MCVPKTGKSRHDVEIPVMISNQPSAVILDTVWGRVLDKFRTLDWAKIDQQLKIVGDLI